MILPPEDLFFTAHAVSVVPQKKLFTFCHSGFDPESSILGLISRWSLLRNDSTI